MFRACMLDTVGSSFVGSSQQSYFSGLIKRYMSSKILYTPDNRHTRRIIEKVSNIDRKNGINCGISIFIFV